MEQSHIAYIPDPSKNPIALGNHPSLDAHLLQALQKPAQPLMTVVPVAAADSYVSQKHNQEIRLNGAVQDVPVYEHGGISYYRRDDLDALHLDDLVEPLELKRKEVNEYFDTIREQPSFTDASNFRLAAIISGDVTIDFLIRGDAFAVADAYAHALYQRIGKEGELSLWPLAHKKTQQTYKADYESYSQARTEEQLLALYKKHYELSRGFLAVVAHFLLAQQQTKTQEKQGTTKIKRLLWRGAWKQLKKEIKHQRNPVLLTNPEFDWLAGREDLYVALVSGYKAIYHASETARNILIEKNSGLVGDLVTKYLRPHILYEDLFQEGAFGLIQASTLFDWKRGFRFSTYATHWIAQKLQRSIHDTLGIYRVPVYKHTDMNKVRRVGESLTRCLRREPSSAELLAGTLEFVEGMSPERAEEALQLMKRRDFSLDAPLPNDKGKKTTYHTVIPDPQERDPTEGIYHSEKQEQVEALLSCLTEQEQRVIKIRYGLITGEGVTLEETAKILAREEGTESVTREWIRQIECKALRKMRASEEIATFLKRRAEKEN